MFSIRKKLIAFFTSYSSVPIVSECRYISEYKAHVERSKIMGKLLNKGSKSKKKWHQTHVPESVDLLVINPSTTRHQVTNAQRIRAQQLSHVLYDRITQIINTGELSEEILGKQVLITSVKMLPDFGGVHVYWDSNRSDSLEVEPLLLANARKLRSLLISYHVLGRIPVITFVKDKNTVDLTLLNQLFEVADYGPDYVPSSNRNNAPVNVSNQLSSRWSSSLEFQSSHPSTATGNDTSNASCLMPDSTQTQDMNKNGNLDSENTQTSELKTQDVNVMQGLNFRTNLYGLPHEDLMKKVTAHRTKVKISDTVFSTAGDTTNFNASQLRSVRDKIKLKSLGASTKFKQQILDRDVEDFMDIASGNSDHPDETPVEEFGDGDEWKEN